MTSTTPTIPPTPTAADLGLVWAIHAPEIDPFCWQLALADNRVVLLSADCGRSVVLAGGGEFREPDYPKEVPLPLIPPHVLTAAAGALRAAEAEDIYTILHDRRLIGQLWGVEDVVAVRPDLSDDQSWAVLLEVDRTRDADNPITWQRLEEVAADLFGPAPDAVVDDD